VATLTRPQVAQRSWRWLLLTLLVLLLHLAFLQSLPLGLQASSGAASSTPLRFATRSVAEATDPLTRPGTDTAELRPRAQARAARQPAPAAPADAAAGQDAPAPPPADSAADAAPTASVLAQASDLASTSAEPAQAAASAPLPEPAAIGQAPSAAASAVAEATADTQTGAAPDAASASAPTEELAPQRAPRLVSQHLFQAHALSASARLIYQVRSTKLPVTAQGELLWHNLGLHYQARLSYSLFGLHRAQSSRGRITDAGLAPERFGDKYRSEVAAHFDYPQHRITFSANTPEAPLLVGAQDRLSVLLQIGALVASNPAEFGAGTTLTVQTASARSAETWLFTFEDMQTLELPNGPLPALKLVRLPRQMYDQTIEVWLAPALGYLPARIRITDANGHAVDQQWVRTEDAGAPP